MSDIKLDVYLFFLGNCQEAMEFYKGIFGGDLSLQTYGDVGDNRMGGDPEWIMHAHLEGGEVRLFASDAPKASPELKKASLCLGGSDETRLREIFDKLAEGGKVFSPLKKEFWGDIFGSLTDRYGIEWMVNVSQPETK